MFVGVKITVLSCREMLPLNSNIACLGALTYTAIVKVMSDSGGDSDRLIKAHQTVNGKMDLNKTIIIFPCRTRYIILWFDKCMHIYFSGVWHWIMVAVAPGLRK